MLNEIDNAECRTDNRVIFWVVFCFTPDLRLNLRKIRVIKDIILFCTHWII